MDVSTIYQDVHSFFKSRGKKLNADETVNDEPNDDICLLRIACMGNAERTIQGELVAYLRSRGRFALLEAGFRQLHSPTAWRPKGTDRHIDILILDEKHIPLVTIELKHYSPHQGKIDPLCVGLESDFDKLPRPIHGGKSVPLIQVGIHTEIIEIRRNPVNAPFSLQDFEFYRFLLAYVFKGSNGEAVIPTNIVPYADFKTNSADFDSWLAGLEGDRYLPSTEGICPGPTEHFVTPASHNGNYEIIGRINFFVGLAV
jgi:hypothetical protein